MSSSHLDIIPVKFSMNVVDADVNTSFHFSKYITYLWQFLNCFNVVIVQPHLKKHDLNLSFPKRHSLLADKI